MLKTIKDEDIKAALTYKLRHGGVKDKAFKLTPDEAHRVLELMAESVRRRDARNGKQIGEGDLNE